VSAAEWDLFISYAREDRAWVTVLAENLHELGFEVFFDAWEVGPGAMVTLALEEGVKKSRCGVVVVSPAALGRPWVLEEYAAMMGEAVGRGIRIVPVPRPAPPPPPASPRPRAAPTTAGGAERRLPRDAGERRLTVGDVWPAASGSATG